MRISDWSSDVCSSDLVGGGAQFGRGRHLAGSGVGGHGIALAESMRASLGAAPGSGERPQADQPIAERIASAALSAAPESSLAPSREIGSASWRERVCQYV